MLRSPAVGGPGLVDVHAHVVLEATMGAAGPACGPEIGADPDGRPWFRVGDWTLHGVPYRGSLFMDPDLRLAAMDEAGVGVQALSPNPLTYLHWIPAADAVAFCRRHNDELAEVVRAHPERFVGFAALPMQDRDAAVAELERSVTDLGLLGPYIGTDFGVHLDHPDLDGLWSACVELDVPCFLHPAPSGLDGPRRDDRMRRFDLDLVVEFSYEELVSVAMLVFGGVTRRHPRLDLCLSHAGGSTPMHVAKLRTLAERRPSVPEWIREPGAFDAALGRLWFDCHVVGESELDFAAGQLGWDRLVFGTNFGGWDRGTAAHLGDRADALNANAVRLLRLERRAPRAVACLRAG